MTLHLPTLIVAAIATMMMSSALMTLFGRTQRIYRGFWWWTAAQWMGTVGLALQLLRDSHPEMLPLSNLLLMQWPIVTLIGVRRFYPRQVLPLPPLADVLLLAFAYLLWAATWAAGGDFAARVAAFGAGACVLFVYSAAITALLQARHRSSALKALIAVQCLAALVQALRAAQASVAEIPWLARDDVTLLVGLSSAMLAIAMVYLSLLLTHERTTLKLAESQRRLRTLAYTDMLTEVPNRRHFYELATKALALRKPGTAAIVTFDIDHFKHINDTHGHQVGDAVLVAFAQLARSVLRDIDVMGRWGGEEFLIILPDTDQPTQAQQALERLQTRLSDTAVCESIPTLRVSFSAGYALWRPPEDVEGLLQRADRALYAAKHAGRKCCVQAD